MHAGTGGVGTADSEVHSQDDGVGTMPPAGELGGSWGRSAGRANSLGISAKDRSLM